MNSLSKTVAVGMAMVASASVAADPYFRGAPRPLLVPPQTVLMQPQLAPEPMVLPAPGYAQPQPVYTQVPQAVPQVQSSADMFYVPATPAAQCFGCDLYHNVRYRQTRNAHPFAVEMIVDVPDPCQDWDHCCPTKFVKVKICVPPCDCARVCVTRNGRRWKYDFGKYEVNIISTKRAIIVDYND